MSQVIRIGAKWQGTWGIVQVACEFPLNEQSASLSRHARGLKPYDAADFCRTALPALAPGVRMLPGRKGK